VCRVEDFCELQAESGGGAGYDVDLVLLEEVGRGEKGGEMPFRGVIGGFSL
jgi:hypothetical protein